MRKPHQIWALVSPAMHKKLKEYAVENQIASTRAKMIMYILYNFHPDQLLEDYTFQSKVGRMVNIKVSDAELEYIKSLAQRYNVTISRLLRNMVYTYFHSMEKKEQKPNFIKSEIIFRGVKKEMGQNNDGVLNFASTLWAAADRLRNNMEPSEYKHIVLGLIFLKYISDAFKYRREELERLVKDPENEEYYCETEEEVQLVLEDKDEYIAANVFYVPKQARYEYIMANARRSDIGKLIDDAMDLIEKENPKQLRGVLPKVYTKAPLDPHTLGEIVNLIGSINFGKNEELDVLGRVYEYFLSEFARKEGKRGGEFFTPSSVVKLLVEMIQPLHGRVFDPCCGSGGMFSRAYAL